MTATTTAALHYSVCQQGPCPSVTHVDLLKLQKSKQSGLTPLKAACEEMEPRRELQQKMLAVYIDFKKALQ